MAKRIIILDRDLSPGRTSFKVVLWLDVPAGRQSFYADPNKTSAYMTANAAELVALRTGAIMELVEDVSFAGAQTLAQVQAALIARWNVAQTEMTNRNPWNRYGTFWDGTAWTAGGAT